MGHIDFLTSLLGVSSSQDLKFDLNADERAVIETEVLLVHDSYVSSSIAVALPVSVDIHLKRPSRNFVAIHWVERADIFGAPSKGLSAGDQRVCERFQSLNIPVTTQYTTIDLTAVPTASRLFLTPHNENSLKFAKDCGPKIRHWFRRERRIMREGQLCKVLEVDEKNLQTKEYASSQIYLYTVASVSPFRQSMVDDNTAICVLWCSDDGSAVPLVNNVPSHSSIVQESDSDTLILDESYLASVVLPATNTDHNAVVANTSVFGHCIVPQFWTSLSVLCDDMYLALLVSGKDLNLAGIFDNEWAFVSVNGQIRVVRVRLWSGGNSGMFGAHPVMFHNMNHTSRSDRSIKLRLTGIGQDPFPFPAAELITLARVFSPSSDQSVFRALLHHARKTIPQGENVVLKTGDLLPMELITDNARILTGFITLMDQSTEEELLLNINLELPWEKQFIFRTPVMTYHKVTSIAHQEPGLLTYDDNVQLNHMAAITGEFGSYIHPAKTRVSQLGTEQSYIPPFDCDVAAGLLIGRLLEIIRPFFRNGANNIELTPSFLLHGPRGVGKRHAAQTVAKRLGVHFCEVDCYTFLDDAVLKAQRRLKTKIERASRCGPCVLFFNHIDCLAQERQTLDENAGSALIDTLRHGFELLGVAGSNGFPILAMGSASADEPLPLKLAELFKHVLVVDAPDDDERHSFFFNLLREDGVQAQNFLSSLVRETAALLTIDLQQIIAEAKLSAVERCSTSSYHPHFVLVGVVSEPADFSLAVSSIRRSSAQVNGAPRIPTVSWDDVGGLRAVKEDILDTILLPLQNPGLFADGLKKRSGILLHGPPGTGKTMLAKAVATSCSLNFMSVKGPELLNMYIGESEANVRRIFRRARDARPCVIFFDELDSIAPARGKQGDSGGVMDRIVSQLLAELDGLAGRSGSADIFVIGATNRPDLLDPALLRPGRFDRLLYLGVSETHEEQANIIRALTRNFMIGSDFEVLDVARRCPLHYTGADFYAMCSDALLEAMTRKARYVENKLDQLQDDHPYAQRLTPQAFFSLYSDSGDTEVCVSPADFEKARSRIIPSVSQLEMEHYRMAQERFTKGTG